MDTIKTLKLTDEQRRALEETAETGPVTVIDAASGRTFVLISASIYERYRALFETEVFDIRETYAAQGASADDAWSHPTMRCTMTSMVLSGRRNAKGERLFAGLTRDCMTPLA